MKLELTAFELKTIGHSLGVHVYGIITNRNTRKDRILPKEFYRNYYSYKGDELFDKMVEDGLFTAEVRFGNNVFFVTEAGERKFRSDFQKLCPYVKPKDRGVAYLSTNIDSYCFICDYTLDSESIFRYFRDYYLKGHRVSSSVEDVIERFKKNLKKIDWKL